jgi:hypothetical protein
VQTLLWILLATLAGGVLSVLIAALFALSLLRRWVPQLVSYAVGVLLAAAFLDILPELSASGLPATPAFATVLAGMMGFFVLEKFAHWHHAHGAHEQAHEPTRPAGFMILLGDALHSLVDGVLLAAAFLHDPRLGLVTTATIVGHEIPHKVGDFNGSSRFGLRSDAGAPAQRSGEPHGDRRWRPRLFRAATSPGSDSVRSGDRCGELHLHSSGRSCAVPASAYPT